MVTQGLIFLQFFNTEWVTAALQLLLNCFLVAENFQGSWRRKKVSSFGALIGLQNVIKILLRRCIFPKCGKTLQ